MPTELEQNKKLQRFIELLAQLNHQTVEIIQSGDMQILMAMNDTVEEMYAIQKSSQEEVYTAIDEEMEIICKNFNAIVTMLKSSESDAPDEVTSAAIKKFLHNVFEADVRIVYAYGLAE